MNELVRRFAKKSGFSLDSTGIYTAKLEHLPITENMEKFAELIVRECVICAEREWIRNGDTEHNRAVTKVIESIKQHFGVEE